MSPAWSWHSTGDEVVQEFPEKVAGRTFLITGPSPGGIGSETVYSLAKGSPSLIILAGRDRAKIDPVIANIRSLNGDVKTLFIPLDLSDLASVREAAAMLNAQVNKIDVMLNNAAVMACPYTRTKDGLEMQFATNHVGHFLLTNLILPKIRAAGPGARIVNVSSSGHRYYGIRFDDVGFQNGEAYDQWQAYGQSKTANILFSVYLAAKIPSKEITTLSLHPGSIMSGLVRHVDMEELKDAMERASKIEGFKHSELKSLQQGCATSLVAALDPSLEAHSGSFLNDGQLETPAKHAQGPEAAEKLWKLTEDIIGQEFPL